jgi:hypothetical protein
VIEKQLENRMRAAAGGPRTSAGTDNTATGRPSPVCQSPDDGEPGTDFVRPREYLGSAPNL